MSNPYGTPATARVCYCHTQKHLCSEWWHADNPGARFAGQEQGWNDGRPCDVLLYWREDGGTESLHFDVGYLAGRGGGRVQRRANDAPLSTAQHILGDVLIPSDVRWWRNTIDARLRDAFDGLLARPLAIDPRSSRDRTPVLRLLPVAGAPGGYVLTPVFDVPDPNQAVQLHGYERWSMPAFRAVIEELTGTRRPDVSAPVRARPCDDGPPAAHFLNEFLVTVPEGTLARHDLRSLAKLLAFARSTGRFTADEVAGEVYRARLADDERRSLLATALSAAAAEDEAEVSA